MRSLQAKQSLEFSWIKCNFSFLLSLSFGMWPEQEYAPSHTRGFITGSSSSYVTPCCCVVDLVPITQMEWPSPLLFHSPHLGSCQNLQLACPGICSLKILVKLYSSFHLSQFLNSLIKEAQNLRVEGVGALISQVTISQLPKETAEEAKAAGLQVPHLSSATCVI